MMASLKFWQRTRPEYAMAQTQSILAIGRRDTDEAHAHNEAARSLNAREDYERDLAISYVTLIREQVPAAREPARLALLALAKVTALDSQQDEHRELNDGNVIAADQAMADATGLLDVNLRQPRDLGDNRGIDAMDDGGGSAA